MYKSQRNQSDAPLGNQLMVRQGAMSKKRANPFGFLYSQDSDTESASEGEVHVSNHKKDGKRMRYFKNSATNSDPEVEILKVEPGPTSRHVQIVKVEHPTKKTPDVEIVKVIPGHSDKNPKWPIICRKIKVEGSVGKPRDLGNLLFVICFFLT